MDAFFLLKTTMSECFALQGVMKAAHMEGGHAICIERNLKIKNKL